MNKIDALCLAEAAAHDRRSHAFRMKRIWGLLLRRLSRPTALDQRYRLAAWRVSMARESERSGLDARNTMAETQRRKWSIQNATRQLMLLHRTCIVDIAGIDTFTVRAQAMQCMSYLLDVEPSVADNLRCVTEREPDDSLRYFGNSELRKSGYPEFVVNNVKPLPW